MRFKDIEIGQAFFWKGVRYIKIKEKTLPRYGIVNAIGPKYYENDDGHRFFQNDEKVWTL